MNRRFFLGGLVALGCQGTLMSPLFAASSKGKKAEKKQKCNQEWDDDLVVIISDLHTNPSGYQPDKLRKVVSDIVTMKPKPRNVIALGDLAYLQGKKQEYELLSEIVAPIQDAGIQLTMGMGNHDRHDNFAAVFPQLAQQSLVPGKMVFRVETPRAVMIVLDSMQKGSEGESDFIVAGAVDDAQMTWLKGQLDREKKPVFVMAHHPIAETKVNTILLDSPTCAGYIYGHDHRWRKDWFKKNYSERLMLRTLCMPSTGHWGDIGYTCLELGESFATARLNQSEFYFPSPAKEGEETPLAWQQIIDEHKEQTCRFAYRQ